MLDIGSSNPNYIPSALLSKRIKEFHSQAPSLIAFLKKHNPKYYKTID